MLDLDTIESAARAGTADPPTVLALCGEVRRLRDNLADAAGLLERLSSVVNDDDCDEAIRMAKDLRHLAAQGTP